MTTYAKIAQHVDKGRGIAARNLGQPFRAYRLDPSSSGDWPEGWLVTNNKFPLFRRRWSQEGKIETGLTRGALWFELIANMGPFLVGDVFLQIDPDYVPGVSYGAGATLEYDTDQFEGIGFAVHTPVGKSIGGRLDRRVMIHRPNRKPAQLANDGGKFRKTTLDDDVPLVMVGGKFKFGPPGGAGNFVPAGFAAYDRQYGQDLFSPDVPAMPKPSRYFIFLPSLPGYTPTEGDAIVCEDGSRYVVELPFYQQAGVSGSQLVAHRQIAQT